MTTESLFQAKLSIPAEVVRQMLATDATGTLSPVQVSIAPVNGDPEKTVVTGAVHEVMRVIGVLASFGETCLLSACAVEHAEALDAAAAYVELYTGNGTRKQPPPWAMDAEGQFLPEVIAARARAASTTFQA